MDGRVREELIDRRLRELGALCGALLGGAGLCAALVLVLAARAGGELSAVAPGTLPFILALAAMLVILLSSAARSAILRRAREREEEAADEERWGAAESAGKPHRQDAQPEQHRQDTQQGALGQDVQLELHRQDAQLTLHLQDAQLTLRLAAYVRATQVSFAMLAAAAGAGLAAALAGGVPFYGLVVCATSALAMAARWPRRFALDRLLEGQPPGAG